MSDSWIFIIIAVPIALIIVVAVWSNYLWEKKVRAIKQEFNLVEGGSYDILQNNGRMTKGLTFVEIYHGNSSINGNINLLFIKHARYRDGTIEREVVIKYGSIWKTTKLD